MFPARSGPTGAWRGKSARRSLPRAARAGRGRSSSKLQVRKGAYADAGHQHFVLGVGDGVSDVLVQQIVADETDRHFACAEPGWIELGLVSDLRLQQIIARGRC